MILQKLNFSKYFENEQNLYDKELYLCIGILKIKTKTILEISNGDIKELVQKLSKICKQFDSNIQIFNDKMIISIEHLIKSVVFAEKAFINNTNISKSIEMEYLLYSSLQRQINIALDRMGVDLQKDNDNNQFAFVITSNFEENLERSFNKIMNLLNAEDISNGLSNISREELLHIIKVYDMSDFELKNAFMIKIGDKSKNLSEMTLEEVKSSAILCIDEKLSLLSIENYKNE